MRPESIPLTKKQRFLLALTEDRFRDIVVRPLLLRQGLRDGRDLCGPDEEGKDAAFFETNALGIVDLWVVQTKKGKLNLTRNASNSVVEATTQLKTALCTKVTVVSTKQTHFPSKAILCASGTINEAARKHIAAEVNDPRLIFLDADELIPRIDQLYPELWQGIDPQIYPYLRAVKLSAEAAAESLLISELGAVASPSALVGSDYYVPLRLYRTVMKLKRLGRRTERVPQTEEIPLEGVIRKHSQVLTLIRGEAGAGKSTALRQLAYVMACASLEKESGHEFPILLRASQMAQHGGVSVIELAKKEAERLSGGRAAPFTVEDLAAGRVVILVDALDEIGSLDDRDELLSRLSAFHELYPRCKIICTAREEADTSKAVQLAPFAKYTISAISFSQASKIIDRVKRGNPVPAEERQEILRRLQQVHGIQLNPLLVTVFAATSEYCGRDVPANITELFKKYTEMMLGRWDKSKGLAQQYQAPMKDFVLRHVAVTMHRSQAIKLSVDDFRRAVRDELAKRDRVAEAKGVCDELLGRSGLLREIDGEVSFRHLLLQEFFAGRGLPRNELQNVIANPWWRRAIVFFFGEHPDDSASCEDLRVWADGQPPKQRLRAALALGLGMQACYLVEAEIKLGMLRWIIGVLAGSKDFALEEFGWLGKAPVLWAMLYYLGGRESVGIALNADDRLRLAEELEFIHGDTDRQSAETFWRITALMEMGAIAEAATMLKKWRPSDERLLFGVLVGCVQIRDLRVAPKKDREIAGELAERIRAKIPGIIEAALRETRTILVEVRKGELMSVSSDGEEARPLGEGEAEVLPS